MTAVFLCELGKLHALFDGTEVFFMGNISKGMRVVSKAGSGLVKIVKSGNF